MGEPLTIVCIINGRGTSVTVNAGTPVYEMRDKALKQNGETGRPGYDWSVRSEEGSLIDHRMAVGGKHGCGIQDGDIVYISLLVGFGGELPHPETPRTIQVLGCDVIQSAGIPEGHVLALCPPDEHQRRGLMPYPREDQYALGKLDK